MSNKTETFAGILGGVAGAILTLGVIISLLTTRPALFASLLSNHMSMTPSTSTASASPAQPSVTDVVAKVNPAVVSIIISQEVPVMEQYMGDPFGANDPFGLQVPMERQNGTQNQTVGGGSGFLISSDGYIVTNAHVVDQTGASYTVFTNDGKKYPAKVIAADTVLDIALIKIDATNEPFLTFGDSSKLQLGQTVIAIGNALGEFRNTVSVGVVSGLSRSIVAGDDAVGSSEALDNVIQTDAAINPGNSGGPLLDLNGNVIGVDAAVANGAQNIGFALPANVVKDSVESMKTNGKVIRAFLGVRSTPVTAELQQENNLSVDYGALVLPGQDPTQLAVEPGSPADKAGIVENDIILQIDAQKLDDTHSLADIIGTYKPGDKITMIVQHHGSNETLTVTLGTAPTGSQ